MQLGNEENSEGTENGSSTNAVTKIKLNDDKCSEHDNGSLITAPLLPEEVHNGIKHSNWGKLMEEFKQIAQELKAPPTSGAFLGFLFGAIPWLRVLINGENAPLRFVEDALRLLGDGTVPSVTLILGANLTQGQRKKILKPTIMVAIICVRYVILPIIGIIIIKSVHKMGFLLDDPLYHFMLMIQFTTPPAMAIGTMAELFDVSQDECSVIFLWTYLTAAVALTFWPSVYMWILS
ncbi:hypothetical protein AXF42_Ash019613 [Apostasia shenzhenica]|uniref:Protein PIN-LIKES 7 n=1 Tax=Apostasia shenzhenica TaxID=1088818 RepID=A0A2I0A3H9_9ASPA|nr:hypothetical protein AXF42_Ash019613 [Apostasia shenzhenica]